MKSRRNTSQRAMVAEIAKSLYHPSAEEVYAEVKKREKGIGRATVFRNLNFLADNGVFMKVCFRGEPARFDTNHQKHDHFVCNICRAITDLPPLPQTDNDAEKDELVRRGFKVESKSVAYYGVCDKCDRPRLSEQKLNPVKT